MSYYVRAKSNTYVNDLYLYKIYPFKFSEYNFEKYLFFSAEAAKEALDYRFTSIASSINQYNITRIDIVSSDGTEVINYLGGKHE